MFLTTSWFTTLRIASVWPPNIIHPATQIQSTLFPTSIMKDFCYRPGILRHTIMRLQGSEDSEESDLSCAELWLERHWIFRCYRVQIPLNTQCIRNYILIYVISCLLVGDFCGQNSQNRRRRCHQRARRIIIGPGLRLLHSLQAPWQFPSFEKDGARDNEHNDMFFNIKIACLDLWRRVIFRAPAQN